MLRLPPSEQAVKAAADLLELVRQANADAVMQAEAFTLGKFDDLVKLKVADLQRRMEARYAAANTNG